MEFEANICDLSKHRGNDIFEPHTGNFKIKMIAPNNSRIEINNKGKLEIFRVIKTIVFHAGNRLPTLPIVEQILNRTDELFIDRNKEYFLLKYFPSKPIQNIIEVALMSNHGDIKKVNVLLLPSSHDYICHAKKCFRSKNIVVKKDALLLNYSGVSDISQVYTNQL